MKNKQTLTHQNPLKHKKTIRKQHKNSQQKKLGHTKKNKPKSQKVVKICTKKCKITKNKLKNTKK